MEAKRRVKFIGVELTCGMERPDRGEAMAVERGGWSEAALHFFKPGDGASRRRRTGQGTPQPWSEPGWGSGGLARGRDGVMAEARSCP
jgi:hypothetical protein